jgi:DNA helicase II / ATP-dependent DNA helicase PcrA
VLGKLFDCRKTILGDAAQSVNPEAGSTAADIRLVLEAAPPVKLTKSYRSSLEIMRFALAIAPNAELEPIERHGPALEVVLCQGASEVTARIKAEVEAFDASPHRTLAIIAKTQKQAATLHRRLAAAGVKARLLDAESSGFSTGSIVCTAHLAKGLEFDRVIVPDASAHTFRTEMDRNLLYIACTRAMHHLTVISDGEPSSLLPKAA